MKERTASVLSGSFTQETSDAVRYDAVAPIQSSTTVTVTSMLPRVALEYGHT